MVHHSLFLRIFHLSLIFLFALTPLRAAFSRTIQEGDNTYIVDLHGEQWDITQAKSIGFLPEKFQHGIGRYAFTPLDDSDLSDQNPNVSDNLRVIGISSDQEANAYSVRKLWRHEVANSRIGNHSIAAAY
jgi:hypothetical protein